MARDAAPRPGPGLAGGTGAPPRAPDLPAIRDFRPADAPLVDALALRAFEQYREAYHDWPAFRARIASLSALAGTGEIILAEVAGRMAGAVAYVGPAAPKAAFFRPEWPIMRMLVVDPAFRGLGAGRALAEECLRRARRDGAAVFALHTSPLMTVALPMYQRMGFRWAGPAPDVHGVAYGVYLKRLDEPPGEPPPACPGSGPAG